MESRMSRHNYDDEDVAVSSRQKKNEELYKQDYDDGKILVPKISNGRELDEDEFLKIINQSQTRSMRKITKKDIEDYEMISLKNKKEEKVYDINEVLESAKNRRNNPDDSKYDVPKFDDYASVDDEDNEDNSDLLSDLMGNDNTVVTKGISNETIIDQTSTNTKIDDSFYSKSIKFKKKDFNLDEEDDDDEDVEPKKSKSQIAITVVIVILLIAAVVLGILVLSKIKF